MNTSEVLQMIGRLKETGFEHIDVSHEGSHILLSNSNFQQSTSRQEQSNSRQEQSGSLTKVLKHNEQDSSQEVVKEIEPEAFGHLIESPIVGTFYRAAGPDSEDFVQVGSKVTKGDVLCIIEAMKLMNEIEADCSGEIAEILVANEAGIEYGQALFRIV